MGRDSGKLSDGSYWSITNIIDLSPASTDDCPLPDDGLFKISLRIHQSYVTVAAVFRNEEFGDSTWTRELQHSITRVPTLDLPGNMNRIDYYLAFHKWLHSLHLDFPLDPDSVDEFTDQVLEGVFGPLELDQKVALYVSADLHRAPVTVDKDDEEDEPMEDDEEEEYEPMEVEEEYDPIEDVDEEYEPMEDEEEYDPIEYEYEEDYDPVEFVEDNGDERLMIKPWVQKLIDSRTVVAVEEHCKLGDCLICLDPLFSLLVSDKEEDGNKKKCLFGSPCGHYFHGHCMSEWLTRSHSCPLCRFDFSSLIEQ